MSKVVNLRTARKQRARAEKRAAGAEAATRSGEAKADRARREDEAARAARHLDGHRRDPGSSEGGQDPDPGPVSRD